METFSAAFGSWWGGVVAGIVVGHFFGDWIWQTAKHEVVTLYQSLKHKIVPDKAP